MAYESLESKEWSLIHFYRVHVYDSFYSREMDCVNRQSFEAAVTFLHNELSPQIIAQLKSSNISQHFGISMMVRNALRRSDVPYDDVLLDGSRYYRKR